MYQALKRAFVERGYERPLASDPYNSTSIHGRAVTSTKNCTVLYVMSVSV